MPLYKKASSSWEFIVDAYKKQLLLYGCVIFAEDS